MEEIAAPQAWPESMLSGYSAMLSVSEVAQALNLEERNVRQLLTNTHAGVRLPGVKIGKSWRIARDELGDYLRGHHNTTNTAPADSRVRPS